MSIQARSSLLPGSHSGESCGVWLPRRSEQRMPPSTCARTLSHTTPSRRLTPAAPDAAESGIIPRRAALVSRGVDMTSVCQLRPDAGRKNFLSAGSFFILPSNTPGPAPRWGQYCRRLILLISVDWVPPYCDPSRACLTLGTRVGRSRLLTSSRVARTPWPHPDADPRLG